MPVIPWCTVHAGVRTRTHDPQHTRTFRRRSCKARNQGRSISREAEMSGCPVSVMSTEGGMLRWIPRARAIAGSVRLTPCPACLNMGRFRCTLTNLLCPMPGCRRVMPVCCDDGLLTRQSMPSASFSITHGPLCGPVLHHSPPIQQAMPHSHHPAIFASK